MEIKCILTIHLKVTAYKVEGDQIKIHTLFIVVLSHDCYEPISELSLQTSQRWGKT